MLLALLGLTFGLRLYRLDASPLRGDEAFAVRIWAGDPVTTVNDWYNREPHPLGTFLSFWAWKTLAGESEFAMRYLPVLGNLIGAAAVIALGKRLFRSDAVALLAGGLWAVNPFLIWHAQDVRNYALWAGLSPLAMLCFLRALDSNDRRTWVVYVLVETLALYMFFLEAFFVIVQGLVLLTHGKRTKNSLTSAIFAWLIIGLLLIPWFAQIWLLRDSGYEGNTETSSVTRLVSWFLPVLLGGEHLAPVWSLLIRLGWIALFGVIVLHAIKAREETARLLAAWILLPVGLLLIVGTRMAVFHPRYLIAMTPALLFTMILPLQRLTLRRAQAIITLGVILLIPVASVPSLARYYRGDFPKSANWPALATYLDHRAQAGEFLISTNPDPALRYYYQGDAYDIGLDPLAEPAAQLRPELYFFNGGWIVGRNADAEKFLNDNMQLVSFDDIPGFPIMQFRRWEVDPAEIETPADVRFGDVAKLAGYTIQGPDPAISAITVILYWEPLRQTEIDYKVFVHLVGPPHPAPLWDQDDARPVDGFASTLEWDTNRIYRDPYHLLDAVSTDLAPGVYHVEVGFYDPATNQRLTVIDADGEELGDSFAVFSFDFPLGD